MDILTHAISGTAVAACASSFIATKPLYRTKILLAGTLGGIFPDLDAISMWSGFDSSFGKLFELTLSGRQIYGTDLWYSHHAFFHSLLASICFGLLLQISICLIRKLFYNKSDISADYPISTNGIYFVTFTLGYWAHLAGDIPTPSSVWGGIALLWPSKVYVGGYGKIWWWNNYDIFLLILCCIFIILFIPSVFGYIRNKVKAFSTIVLCSTLILILIQINSREYDYAYKGDTSHYMEMELNSRKEQERILGKRLYLYMAWIDNKLKFHF